MRVYIGNRNYSSWSLRGWLAVKLSGEPFEEVQVELAGTGPNPANTAFSPSGLVPCLHDGDAVVWDSLAIAEHLAERHPGMWPTDPAARAWARSIAAEMHSGFSALRSEMAMCIRERVDVRPWSAPLAADIVRITGLFDETRRRFGASGAYLCGSFSIADCFYAPVAFRFRTYAVTPSGSAGAYVEALLAHPLLREWEAAALAETAIIEADEPRVIYRDKLARGGGAPRG
ncbi:MAG: glutathione S-transferase family protein [Betaproteobacteria bacterium]|nr:glutathione S-transferase family protein [Betaproteobacteria bacterium]MDE2210302.1 glutathione S-transferase family protein [Betaproteobacteria bacterium]MDE2359916.1 glutathione S-transferase family protein [Betaproteobacteria bacterium]